MILVLLLRIRDFFSKIFFFWNMRKAVVQIAGISFLNLFKPIFTLFLNLFTDDIIFLSWQFEVWSCYLRTKYKPPFLSSEAETLFWKYNIFGVYFTCYNSTIQGDVRAICVASKLETERSMPIDFKFSVPAKLQFDMALWSIFFS